jgi:hypothetical protein
VKMPKVTKTIEPLPVIEWKFRHPMNLLRRHFGPPQVRRTDRSRRHGLPAYSGVKYHWPIWDGRHAVVFVPDASYAYSEFYVGRRPVCDNRSIVDRYDFLDKVFTTGKKFALHGGKVRLSVSYRMAHLQLTTDGRAIRSKEDVRRAAFVVRWRVGRGPDERFFVMNTEGPIWPMAKAVVSGEHPGPFVDACQELGMFEKSPWYHLETK